MLLIAGQAAGAPSPHSGERLLAHLFGNHSSSHDGSLPRADGDFGRMSSSEAAARLPDATLYCEIIFGSPWEMDLSLHKVDHVSHPLNYFQTHFGLQKMCQVLGVLLS